MRFLNMKKEKDIANIAVSIVQLLFALILIVMICFSFIGCSSIKEIPINNIEKIVYRDTTIYIRDTIRVEVPKEIIKEIVPEDTTSILRTSVALSEAKIEKGMLHHRLEQKGTIPVQIDTVVTIQYVDRIIEKEIPVEVIKEVKHIPNWAWISLIFNIITVLFIAFKIYLRVKGV